MVACVDLIVVHCVFPCYSPPVESRNMRYAMLNQHSDLIGTTKAFDGAVLFLPLRITDTVSLCTCTVESGCLAHVLKSENVCA